MEAKEEHMACKGANTILVYLGGNEAEQCIACEKTIIFDLVDSTFCGFEAACGLPQSD